MNSLVIRETRILGFTKDQIVNSIIFVVLLVMVLIAVTRTDLNQTTKVVYEGNSYSKIIKDLKDQQEYSQLVIRENEAEIERLKIESANLTLQNSELMKSLNNSTNALAVANVKLDKALIPEGNIKDFAKRVFHVGQD
jgi:predicted negative regulator of RcsB-dependent stress response